MKPAVSLNIESLSLCENFKAVVDRIAQMIIKSGSHAIAYHSPLLLVYSRLQIEQQRIVLADAKVYLESLESSKDYGPASSIPNITIKEDYKISLWSALKYFGMRPVSDLFSYLNQDKIVEVYNAEGIQIWRNFNFFEVCGYSIEEMFCYTWLERYERNEETLKHIFAIISRFMSGENVTIKCDIYNQIKELISTQKLTIDAHHEYVSPFYDKENRYAGFVVISSAQVSASVDQAARRPVVLTPLDISDSNLM